VQVKWAATLLLRGAEMRAPQCPDIWLTPESLTPASLNAACVADESSVYLTDGVFVFRVLGFVAGLVETVELEDCYRLDVVRVAMADARTRRLRVVSPHQG
jgi:hypothetical protein